MPSLCIQAIFRSQAKGGFEKYDPWTMVAQLIELWGMPCIGKEIYCNSPLTSLMGLLVLFRCINCLYLCLCLQLFRCRCCHANAALHRFVQIASLPDFRDKCEYLVNVTQCLPGLVYGGARSHLAAEHTAPKTQSPHCTSSRKKAEHGTKWP